MDRDDELTHLDRDGQARMVDVGEKNKTAREARARATLRMAPETRRVLRSGEVPKGDALATARIAGIQAAKQTPALIPLCHPISLNRVLLRSVLRPGDHSVEVFCVAEIAEKTGVEMEALTGLSVALLTIWDLSKPVNPALEITGQRLLFKSGGKHGTWLHPDGLPAEVEAIIAALD